MKLIYSWTGDKLYHEAKRNVNEIAKKVSEKIQFFYPDFDPCTMKVKLTIYPESTLVEVTHLSSNLRKDMLPEGFIHKISSVTKVDYINQKVGLIERLFKLEFNETTMDVFSNLIFTKLRDEQGYQLKRLTKQ